MGRLKAAANATLAVAHKKYVRFALESVKRTSVVERAGRCVGKSLVFTA